MERRVSVRSLIEAHQREIWMYLRTLGCEPHLADDLTQETFVYVFKNPFVEISPAATASYLRKVAKNQFFMALRSKRARPKEVDIEAVDAVFEKDSGRADVRLSALQHCIEALPERTRAILKSRYEEGGKTKDLAASLGIKPALVDTIAHRAKAQVKTCVEERLRHES